MSVCPCPKLFQQGFQPTICAGALRVSPMHRWTFSPQSWGAASPLSPRLLQPHPHPTPPDRLPAPCCRLATSQWEPRCRSPSAYSACVLSRTQSSQSGPTVSRAPLFPREAAGQQGLLPSSLRQPCEPAITMLLQVRQLRLTGRSLLREWQAQDPSPCSAWSAAQVRAQSTHWP